MSRLATLTHAIINRIATPTNSASSGPRISRTASACRATVVNARPTPSSRVIRPATESTSARACASVTPGRIRPITRRNRLPRGPCSRSFQNGCQTWRWSGTLESGGSSNRKLRGMTPMTVVRWSLTRMSRPTIEAIAAEAAREQVPAEQNRRVSAWRAVLGAERASDCALDAEHLKEVRGHERRAELFGISFAGERDRAGRPDRAEVGAGPAAVAKVLQVGTGQRSTRVAQARLVEPDEDEAVGVPIGQRLEQHRVHDAEDGGVRADAERERDDDDDRQPAGAPEAAPCVAKIQQQRIEARPDAPLADVFLDLEDAAVTAERGHRCALGRMRAHAARQIAVGERLHRRADFVVQLARRAPPCGTSFSTGSPGAPQAHGRMSCSTDQDAHLGIVDRVTYGSALLIASPTALRGPVRWPARHAPRPSSRRRAAAGRPP